MAYGLHTKMLSLACWLTYWYFNILSNIVNKKTAKNALFLAALESTGDLILTVAEERQVNTGPYRQVS